MTASLDPKAAGDDPDGMATKRGLVAICRRQADVQATLVRATSTRTGRFRYIAGVTRIR